MWIVKYSVRKKKYKEIREKKKHSFILSGTPLQHWEKKLLFFIFKGNMKRQLRTAWHKITSSIQLIHEEI